jgi:hypothetical protein
MSDLKLVSPILFSMGSVFLFVGLSRIEYFTEEGSIFLLIPLLLLATVILKYFDV